MFTRSLNQRHSLNRGQAIKTLLRSMFLNVIVLNTLNTFTDLKGPNIICTMYDVRGDFSGPPNGKHLFRSHVRLEIILLYG